MMTPEQMSQISKAITDEIDRLIEEKIHRELGQVKMWIREEIGQVTETELRRIIRRRVQNFVEINVSVEMKEKPNG